MKILAIDPGTTESAYVIMDSETYKPLEFDKVDNEDLLSIILDLCLEDKIGKSVIEMVSSYGMPVGKEIFETVFWIGRFYELLDFRIESVDRMYRKDVKMNLCNTTRAKDSNIIQALVDRFAYNVPNRGKGYKKSPAFFYGFKADIWQAYALGVSYLDSVEIEIVEII
jgi:hypothetical protein